MYSENCLYTCRSSRDTENLFRWYKTAIHSARNCAAGRLILQRAAIWSAEVAPQPHKTQAGASSLDANTFAACSIGLSRDVGSRFTSSYFPTWSKRMCPSSWAAVNRCLSSGTLLDTTIIGVCPAKKLSPSLSGGRSPNLTAIPRLLQISPGLIGSSEIPSLIRSFQVQSLAFWYSL